MMVMKTAKLRPVLPRNELPIVVLAGESFKHETKIFILIMRQLLVTLCDFNR